MRFRIRKSEFFYTTKMKTFTYIPIPPPLIGIVKSYVDFENPAVWGFWEDAMRIESNKGMRDACIGGHIRLVYYFIKQGATNWNLGLEGACFGGNVMLINLMCSYGADDWVSNS